MPIPTQEDRAWAFRRVQWCAEVIERTEQQASERLRRRLEGARLTLPVFPVKLVLPTVPEEKEK